jgi:2-hydroxychromene-2-carboxylate isomerase
MSMKQVLRSRTLQLALSRPGTRLRHWHALRSLPPGERNLVRVFLQLDDPYSFLLLNYLPRLERNYAVRLDVRLVPGSEDEFKPAPAMLDAYATRECRMLASELDVPFLDAADRPVAAKKSALELMLADKASLPDYFASLGPAFTAYWRGDTDSVSRQLREGATAHDAAAILEANYARLRELGHYSGGMLHFGGEWYWGIDRILFLLDRLDRLGLRVGGDSDPEFEKLRRMTRTTLLSAVPECARQLPPLELFFSYRSPYSYLALPKAFRIADSFGLDLRLRPVLPMVMRGLAVPPDKIRYIVLDANRCARSAGIPFGLIGDPVGAAAERCIALTFFAEREGRARQFALEAATAIWARGRDLAKDRPLRHVVEAAGLDWRKAREALAGVEWRKLAERNRDEMTGLGVWGVPIWKIGDIALWGQDRDWLVERVIEELCDRGDGIIV